MSICFMPVTTKEYSRNSPIKFRYIENIYIPCSDTIKDAFEKTIIHLFSSYYKMQAIGFTQDTQEFWCKKITNNLCVLHFTCNIMTDEYNNPSIIIKPIIGNDNELVKLKKNIKNYMKLLS